MSLADARVEIIADLSRFRADLRDQMADIAESAGRLLEKRMNKSLEGIQDNVKKLGGTIRSELGNSTRDALKGFDEAHRKSTDTAKRNYKSVATTYRDNMRNANNLVAKEIDERTTRITRDARAAWKSTSEDIENNLTRAAERGGAALDKRMFASAGRTKDEWRAAGNVIGRVLTSGPDEKYDTAGLKRFVDALGGLATGSQRARRSVAQLGDSVKDAAGSTGEASNSVGALGDKLDDAIGNGSERGALRARRALKNIALEASETARRFAQDSEETLRRSRGVYTEDVRNTIRLNSELGEKAAQEARKAADTAATGAGNVADSTARAASRAAEAAEHSARRSAAALETSLGKSRSAFSRTLDFIDKESARRGKNAGYNFADGFKFSFTAGIGSSVGRVVAIAAAIVPFLSPIVSVLVSAAGAATALASALGSAVVGGALAAAAAVAAIGSAFLTVKVGSGGIFDAVKQKALSDKSGVTASGQTATSKRASQRAVENATQNVGSTQRSYTKSVREAADAERDAKIARTKLTEAYVEAKRALEDYDNAVKDTANDERDAVTKAKEAHEALRAAYAKRGTPAIELEKLQNTADEADQKVVETKQASTRAQEDKASGDAKGVEGSDAIVAAKRAIVEADQKVIDSQQAVKDAALAVTNAVRDRDDALADSSDKIAGSTSSATKVLDDMLAKLSPNARGAYKAIIGIQDAWKEATKTISNSLFAKSGPEITKFGNVYLPEVTASMTNIAKTTNGAGLDLSKFLRRAENVTRVKRIFANNEAGVTAFSKALTPLADIFLILLDAIAPYERKVGDLVTKLATLADKFLSSAEGGEKLDNFLRTAYDSFVQVSTIIGLVFGGLFNIFALGSSTGATFLDSLEKMASTFLAWTESVEGRTAIIDWFTEARETAKSLKGLLGELKDQFAKLAGDTDASTFVDELKETVKQLGRLFDQLNEGSTGGGIIDTINGFLKSLADANAGGAIKSFIDTLGEIVDNVVSLVGVVHDIASVFPGGNKALHEFVVLMGTLAAIKFASSIVGIGSLVGTISSTRSKIVGATTAVKTFRAAAKGAEVAESAAAAAPISNLLGKGVAKTKSGGKKLLSTLFPGAPLERIRKTTKVADAVGDSAKVAKAGKGLGKVAAEAALESGDDVAKAGAGLGSRMAKGLKSKAKAVADAAKSLGSAAASRAGQVIKGGDKGSAALDLFVPDKVSKKLEAVGGKRAARKAAKAAGTAAKVGSAASVVGAGADVAKVGVIAKIGGAAKGAVSSVAALTGVLAANTGAALTNGAAWAKNALSIVATKVAMVLTRAATIAYTAVQWLLNAAMAANPIGLVVLAIVALVAIFVIAYKHSETFRNIINALGRALLSIGEAIWTGLKAAFGYVTRFYKQMFDFWTGLPGKIVGWITGGLSKLREIGHTVISKFLEGLSALGKAELSFGKKLANGLISALNSVLDFLNKGLAKIPKALTFGVELKIPTIPKLAMGGIIDRETLAIVGEAGPEVVIPLTRPARARELAEQSGLIAMLQLRDLLPAAPATPELRQPAPSSGAAPVDRSVHVENLHVHHNGMDTARATEKALRRVARLAMS